MIPLYINSYGASVFFASFYIIGFYFLLPLTLAVTYNKTKEQFEEDQKIRKQKRERALSIAFELLDFKREGWLGLPILIAMLVELRHYSNFPKIKIKYYKKFFEILAAEDKKVQKEEFLRFHEIFSLKFTSHKTPKLHNLFPKLFLSDCGKKFVSGVTSKVFK